MAKAQLWMHYKPSLFQHIGTHSSLKGKVQKLKVLFINLFIFFLNLIIDFVYFVKLQLIIFNNLFQDKQFGKITLFYSHVNPDATVETQIKPYKQFTLHKAYKGESFFWGLLPRPGDHLKFKFTRPIFIKKYVLKFHNYILFEESLQLLAIIICIYQFNCLSETNLLRPIFFFAGIYSEVEILSTHRTNFTTRQLKFYLNLWLL